MEGRPIRLIAAVPAPTVTETVLRSFGGQGEPGWVTSLNDALLPNLRGVCDDFPLLDLKTFTGLVGHATTMAGVESTRAASRPLALAAMRAVLRERPSASPFARVARFPGFGRRLARTLSELHEHGYDAGTLRTTLATAELADKLREMADVDDAVAERLAGRGQASLTRQIRALRDATPELDEATGRILVYGGGAFSPAKLDLLKWLASHGVAITYVADAAANGSPLFAALPRVAAYLGVTPEPMTTANRLATNLFAADPADAGLPLARGITVESSGDELAECEWALRRIAAEPEIPTVIVAKAMDAYAPRLEVAARRLGVPLRVHRSEPLLANGLARAFLCLLESLGAPHPDDLVEAFECRYFSLAPTTRARVREMAREADAGAPWGGFVNPIERGDEGHEWLETVLALRGDTETPRPYKEWSTRVWPFFEAGSWLIPDSDAHSAAFGRDAETVRLSSWALVPRTVGSSFKPLSFAALAGELNGGGFDLADLRVSETAAVSGGRYVHLGSHDMKPGIGVGSGPRPGLVDMATYLRDSRTWPAVVTGTLGLAPNRVALKTWLVPAPGALALGGSPRRLVFPPPPAADRAGGGLVARENRLTLAATALDSRPLFTGLRETYAPFVQFFDEREATYPPEILRGFLPFDATALSEGPRRLAMPGLHQADTTLLTDFDGGLARYMIGAGECKWSAVVMASCAARLSTGRRVMPTLSAAEAEPPAPLPGPIGDARWRRAHIEGPLLASTTLSGQAAIRAGLPKGIALLMKTGTIDDGYGRENEMLLFTIGPHGESGFDPARSLSGFLSIRSARPSGGAQVKADLLKAVLPALLEALARAR